jgi:hypothetical protein
MVANYALHSSCDECDEDIAPNGANGSYVYLVTDNSFKTHEKNSARSQGDIVWLEGTLSVAF